MTEVKIITVDADLAAKTSMQVETRMVRLTIPTDRPVTIHAEANAKRLQRVNIFDGDAVMLYEWEGRGEPRTIGTSARTFPSPTLYFSCQSLWPDDGWVVSDLNVGQGDAEGLHQVIIRCEDGGDFPGDWDDLSVTVDWRL